MIKLIEFRDEYDFAGGIAIFVKKTSITKFEEWQKDFKGKKPAIKSVQRTEFGLFVVYEI